MASLENQKGWWRIILRYGGQKHQKALDTQDQQEAETMRLRVEENLKLLRRGRLEYRPGDDLITLLLTDGKLNAEPAVEKQVNLGDFFKRYQDERPPGKEKNTVYTENIHIEHLLRLLGARTAVVDVPGKLQHYINQRSQETGRRKENVSQVTIKKELRTLTGIWNRWGAREKLVPVPLSLNDLEYPKGKEKPRFQTWDEVLRKTKGDATSELWECVFLSVQQVEELLAHVRVAKYKWKDSHFPWVYPMFAFCAYLGARRSEILRSRVEDIDFERNEVTIREKKKDRSKQETYRHVPMPPKLRAALAEWLKVHPGGVFTFCKVAGEPLTEQMANHYFDWALEGSQWAVLRGYHVFRHSLISNLACRGVSEKVIMGIVGHLNAETTRRYLHLYPSTVQSAMELLFGDGAVVAKPG